MTEERFIELIDELIELRIRQHAALQLREKPELAHLVEEKRAHDKARAEEVKRELLGLMDAA
jgi:hypothetical protein